MDTSNQWDMPRLPYLTSDSTTLTKASLIHYDQRIFYSSLYELMKPDSVLQVHQAKGQTWLSSRRLMTVADLREPKGAIMSPPMLVNYYLFNL
jgi:hypothetical protein